MTTVVDVAGLGKALKTATWRREGERWRATVVLMSLRQGEGEIQYDVECAALPDDAPTGPPIGSLWADNRGLRVETEHVANTFAG